MAIHQKKVQFTVWSEKPATKDALCFAFRIIFLGFGRV